MADDKTTNDVPDNATTDPEETVEGQSFYNPALTGSGTINRDGEYVEPLPDPTQVRGLGPNRTAGGRRVLGERDPDIERVNKVTSDVVGEPPSVQDLRGGRASEDTSSEAEGTTKTTSSTQDSGTDAGGRRGSTRGTTSK